MIPFQENIWMDRWKDRQTLFYTTLPATAGGLKGELMVINGNKGFPITETIITNYDL